jgi:WD40 repeat protein
MAPEAIEGAPGRTSDQYSLAITYYQLLTGRLPAEGKSVWEIIDKHRQGKLSFIGVNPAERSVLVKATDVDWTRRYNSCADLVDHLRDAHRLRAEGDSHPASSPDAWRAEDAGAMQTSDFDAASPTKSNTAAQAAANLDTQIAGAPIAHAESKVSHQANFPIQTLDAGPRAIAIDAPQAWRRFLKPAAIIGSLSFCALFAAWTVSGWFRPEALPSVDDSGTSKNSTLENNSGQVERATLASALALFHSDETRAIAEFQRFLASTARTADARECPTTLISGTDSLEALWFIGDQMLLTLGYQPAPMLHLLPSTLTEKTQSISLPRIGSPVYPQAIALTAERRHLLVGGSPPLTVWELQSLRADNLPQPLEVSSIEGEIVAAAWHPQLPVAVAMDDSGSLRVFEFDNHSVKRSSSFEVAWIAQTLCSDVDAKYLIATTVDGDVRRLLWSDILETFELPHTPDDPSIKPAGTIARVLAPLRIGEESLVAVGDTQGTLTLWRLQIDSQWFARTDAHLGPIESLSVSKTNTSILQSVVVSSDSDGGVFVWQPETAASTTRRFGTEPITSTAISKDSRWIVAATRGGVWLWQWTLREDNVVYRVDCGTALVMNVGLDSANNILAAVCDDGSTRLWDFRHLCLLASTTPTLDLPQIPAPKMDHPGVGGKITKTEPKGFPLPTPVFSAIQ